MYTTDPSMLAAELLLHPLIERRIRSQTQEGAQDRARAVTMKMQAYGRVLIAQSWVATGQGGTMTLVFADRPATRLVNGPSALAEERRPIAAQSRRP
jgi:hypothetical protein